MIPKKLHYIWFGKKEKPEFVQFCINSWKKTLPNFEIIEWNEDNFDFAQNTFAREAYEQRKWAFVSDYARAKILHQEGGFYVDTDMEIRLPLDEFTQYRAVCGFEVAHVPFSAFFAVEKGHVLAKKMVDFYDKLSHFQEITNISIFSKMMIDDFGADPTKDEFQELKEGIKLFPSSHFSLDLPKNYIAHHFSGSWHGAWSSDDNGYKNMVNTYGLLHLVSKIPNGKKNVKNVVYNQNKIEIDQVLDQIPLSFIISYVKKSVLKKVIRK